VRIDQYTTLELPPPVINVPLTVEAILHESPDVEKVKEIEYRPTADGSWLPATIRERRQPLPEEIPTVAETIEALP
jgi:hypothetical protein